MESNLSESDKKDIEAFVNHPLNWKEITPEIKKTAEYEAIQSLIFEGTPNESTGNYLVT